MVNIPETSKDGIVANTQNTFNTEPETCTECERYITDNDWVTDNVITDVIPDSDFTFEDISHRHRSCPRPDKLTMIIALKKRFPTNNPASWGKHSMKTLWAWYQEFILLKEKKWPAK